MQARNREDGPGALFTVSLPCHESMLRQSGNEQVPDADRTDGVDWLRGGKALQNTRILVVDDEADAREVVTLILERCGAKVYTAVGAGDAFEIVQRESPDVLVADIEMPGEDGYGLIRRIRLLPPGAGGTIAAIALTAHAAAHDFSKLMNAGFHRHVPKPLQPAELITAILTLTKPAQELGGERYATSVGTRGRNS